MNLFRDDLENKPEIRVAVPIRQHMMCLNESSFNPMETLSREIIESFDRIKINSYTSQVTSELKQALAEYVGFGVDKSQFLFGNGVDEMLYFIFTAVREDKNSYLLSLAPSYFDYSTYSGSVGLNAKFMDFDSNFDFDENKYLHLLNHSDCKLGILCNPNNPTGHFLADAKILYILKNTQKPIIIDETYYEFSGKTYSDKIKEFPNIIITRSFSKSFSAAGLRFGYIYSSVENIRYLIRVIPVFNSNLVTQTIALTFLKHKKVFEDFNKSIIANKGIMFEQMSKYPQVKVLPSQTNFLTFSVSDKTVAFNDYLLTKDISVRPVWAHPLLKNHLRVTVCSEEINNLFLGALDEFLKI